MLETAGGGEDGGDALDGLRALCAAAWTFAGADGCDLEAAKAIARLGL